MENTGLGNTYTIFGTVFFFKTYLRYYLAYYQGTAGSLKSLPDVSGLANQTIFSGEPQGEPRAYRWGGDQSGIETQWNEGHNDYWLLVPPRL